VQALLYLHARHARGMGAGLFGEDTVYSAEQISSQPWAQTMKTPEQLGWQAQDMFSLAAPSCLYNLPRCALCIHRDQRQSSTQGKPGKLAFLPSLESSV
jgi:hypothetical protein